jgi:hypothetical protein
VCQIADHGGQVPSGGFFGGHNAADDIFTNYGFPTETEEFLRKLIDEFDIALDIH